MSDPIQFTPKFTPVAVPPAEPTFDGMPSEDWVIEYKDADGKKAVQFAHGVLKFNPPFFVVVPVDKPESHMHEATFMVMLSELNNVQKIALSSQA